MPPAEGTLKWHTENVNWDGLTAHQVAELTFLLADRGGLLVHLTGHPKALAARLIARDGYAPAPDRITTLLKTYRDVFDGLDGAIPIVTLDTTARPGRLAIPQQARR